MLVHFPGDQAIPLPVMIQSLGQHPDGATPKHFPWSEWIIHQLLLCIVLKASPRRRLVVQAKKNAGRPWTPYHNSSKVREGGREKGEEEEKQLPASSGVDPTDSSHLESVRKGGRRERKGRLPCWLWRLARIQQAAAHLENLREGEGRGRGGGSFLLAPVREGEGGRGRGRGGRGAEGSRRRRQ